MSRKAGQEKLKRHDKFIPCTVFMSPAVIEYLQKISCLVHILYKNAKFIFRIANAI